MRIAIGDCSVECVQSDVGSQSDVDALFYYMAEPAAESVDHDQFRTSTLHPGQASIEEVPGSSGRYIIQAMGPDSADDDLTAETVKCCLVNAIALCEKEELGSVALPLTEGMSRKASMPLVAEIVAKVIADHAHRSRHLRVIRFALASALELNTLPRHLIKAAAALDEPNAHAMKD